MTAQPHDENSISTPPQKSTPSFPLLDHQEVLTATLSALLQSDVLYGDELPPTPPSAMTVFHALEPPSISVKDYVNRLSKYAFCSPSCLLAAMYYVSRVIEAQPSLVLTSLTVHRLLITGVVLACKYLDDTNYNLAYYAKVGGLPTNELINLEATMLNMLDFQLGISVSQLRTLEACLVQRVCVIARAASSECKATNGKKIDPEVLAPLAQAAFDKLNHHDIPQALLLPTSPMQHSPSSSSVSSISVVSNSTSSMDEVSLDIRINTDKSANHNDVDIDDIVNRTTMQLAALSFSNGSTTPVARTVSGAKSQIPPLSPFSGSEGTSGSLSRNSSSDTLSSEDCSGSTTIESYEQEQKSFSSSESNDGDNNNNNNNNSNTTNFDTGDNNKRRSWKPEQREASVIDKMLSRRRSYSSNRSSYRRSNDMQQGVSYHKRNVNRGNKDMNCSCARGLPPKRTVQPTQALIYQQGAISSATSASMARRGNDHTSSSSSSSTTRRSYPPPVYAHGNRNGEANENRSQMCYGHQRTQQSAHAYSS